MPRNGLNHILEKTKKCDSIVDVGNNKKEPEFSIEIVIRKVTKQDLVNYSWNDKN